MLLANRHSSCTLHHLALFLPRTDMVRTAVEGWAGWLLLHRMLSTVGNCCEEYVPI